jgi:hypothetical protein
MKSEEVPMAKSPVKYGVLCDTSFFIRLNNPEDPFHSNARGYLKFLQEGDHLIYVSTIALAEYAVRDSFSNLPMRYLRVLPFNIDHAVTAGEFARIVFAKRDQLPPEIHQQRVIIPNDTKMFAQAHVTPSITHYLTADVKCEGVHKLLHTESSLAFHLLSVRVSHHQTFGVLNLGE